MKRLICHLNEYNMNPAVYRFHKILNFIAPFKRGGMSPLVTQVLRSSRDRRITMKTLSTKAKPSHH